MTMYDKDNKEVILPDPYEVGAGGNKGNIIAYGGRVWKFLNDMKTVPSKTLEKIPGHYDKLLKKAEKILTKYGNGLKPNENAAMGFNGTPAPKELAEECYKYVKCGNNEERVEMIRKLAEQLMGCMQQVTANVLYDNENMKNGTDDRGVDYPEYEVVKLDGKAWENTETVLFKGYINTKTVILGKCVKILSKETFVNCRNLNEIIVETSDLNVEENCIVDCPNLKKDGIKKGSGGSDKAVKKIIDAMNASKEAVKEVTEKTEKKAKVAEGSVAPE